MADVHFHIWHYKRDPGGIIRSLERTEEQYDTRRKANYALELFRRERSLAGQVVQCVDGAFCRPPPDWVVRGVTLAGPAGVYGGVLHRLDAIHPAVAQVGAGDGETGAVCGEPP